MQIKEKHLHNVAIHHKVGFNKDYNIINYKKFQHY